MFVRSERVLLRAEVELESRKMVVGAAGERGKDAKQRLVARRL